MRLFFTILLVVSLLLNIAGAILFFSSAQRGAIFLFFHEHRNLLAALLATALLAGAVWLYQRYQNRRLLRRLRHLGQELKSCRQEVEKLRYSDPLTGLPNFYALQERLEDTRRPVGYLIHLDIDAFYEINDLYGSTIGDTLLKDLAALLRQQYENRGYSLYRIRSDEFIILSEKAENTHILSHELSKLVSLVNNHDFTVADNNFRISIHAGASLERSDLLATADIALKHAKKSGFRNYAIYSESLDPSSRFQTNLQWIKEIRSALEEDRVILYYQPIVRVSDNSINAYECLIRVRDREGKVFPPHDFLELTKRSKLYYDLTIRIIDKAFASFRNHPGHFSINLTYNDIANPTIYEYIMEKIREFPEPSRIHFELLESEQIENYALIQQFIKAIHRSGCAISLDDFGSGYSNFEHLLNLDFDLLKLDGSLIRNIRTDANSRLIVKTILSFARNIGIDTCAEYVGDKETYYILKALGVTYMQGYYLSPPKAYH